MFLVSKLGCNHTEKQVAFQIPGMKQTLQYPINVGRSHCLELCGHASAEEVQEQTGLILFFNQFLLRSEILRQISAAVPWNRVLALLSDSRCYQQSIFWKEVWGKYEWFYHEIY